MANALKQACTTVDLGHKHEVQPPIKHADITTPPTTVKVKSECQGNTWVSNLRINTDQMA